MSKLTITQMDNKEKIAQKALGTLPYFVTTQLIKYTTNQSVRIVVRAINKVDAKKQIRKISKQIKLQMLCDQLIYYIDRANMGEEAQYEIENLTPDSVTIDNEIDVEEADSNDIEYYSPPKL